MIELIKKTQFEWLKAKAEAQHKCESVSNTDMARKLSACTMFKGDENFQSLIDLMFTPQGTEFMTTYGFPDIETFRKYKPFNPEQYGVYIDCGEIELQDPKKAFVVGNTIATIKCSQNAANRIVAMCGASACISASGYSVVKIEKDSTSKVIYTAHDHAKILI